MQSTAASLLRFMAAWSAVETNAPTRPLTPMSYGVPMSEPSSARTVGLIADPGLPTLLARKVGLKLVRLLSTSLDSNVRWRVELNQQSLPLNSDGEVEINSHSEEIRTNAGWDYLVYLTDLPKYANGEPMISSTNRRYASAMIAVPALGVVRKNRLRRTILQVIGELHGFDDSRNLGRGPVARATAVVSPVRVHPSEEGENEYETVKGPGGRIQLLAGMVWSNRPWLIVPRLSTAMAAATATGAFGVFYTSIWSMADYLSPPRLALISVLSVTMMSFWLVAHNGLWERPIGDRIKERRVAYNLATVLTIVFAVGVMYVGLFVVIFAGGFLIIDAQFLSSILKHGASGVSYLNIAWLSASLGTIAGALGSGIDDEEKVRRATFSARENERRRLSRDYKEGR